MNNSAVNKTFASTLMQNLMIALAVVCLSGMANSFAAETVSTGSATFNSQFNQAVKLSLAGQNKKAISAFSKLKETVTGDLRDQVLMAMARTQFQAGDLENASQTLEQVRKGSDFWFEALEERAWVALRNRDPDRALSLLETNLKDLFLPFVGPESYFLAAYSHLRTCNYEKALSTISLFRKNFRDRIVSLQEINKSPGPTEVMTRSLEKLLSDGWKMGSLKKDAHLMPRLMFQDAKLIKIYNSLAKNPTESLRRDFYNRIKDMAQTDLKEMTRIVGQFQILDVEVTQRVYSKQPLNSSLAGINQPPKMTSSTSIRFKHDGEVWLDEVDKYHVRVKGCVPQGRGKQEQVL